MTESVYILCGGLLLSSLGLACLIYYFHAEISNIRKKTRKSLVKATMARMASLSGLAFCVIYCVRALRTPLGDIKIYFFILPAVFGIASLMSYGLLKLFRVKKGLG